MRKCLIFLASSIIAVLCGCGEQVSLSKWEYKMAAVTHFEYAAVLELKKAVGSAGTPYIEGQSGTTAPLQTAGLLDEQCGGWHPGQKRILGIYADLKPGITDDTARSIVQTLRSNLPEGYTASLLYRKSPTESSNLHSILVEKVCGRKCSSKFAPFNQQTWKSGTDQRLPMAETLVHRESLIGLSPGQLLSMLGPGAVRPYPPDPVTDRKRQIYEYLMSDQAANGKQAYLKVLVYDSVAKAWIVRGE